MHRLNLFYYFLDCTKNLHNINYYYYHSATVVILRSKQMNNKYQQMSFDDINDQER